VLLAEGPWLAREELRLAAPAPASGTPDLLQLPAEGLDFEELERRLVQQALERTGGSKTRAAKLLGMPRDWLRYRMEKYGVKS
jgi:DNA-binding NtrC family response regulator